MFNTRVGLAAAAAALVVAGTAGATTPAPGTAVTKGPVRLVTLKPLTVRVTGARPGTVVLVRLTPSTGAARVLRVGPSGLLRLGVDGTSCTSPIVSVTVMRPGGARIGSVRLPIRDCASGR